MDCEISVVNYATQNLEILFTIKFVREKKNFFF